MNAASSSASLWYAVSLERVGNELGDDSALGRRRRSARSEAPRGASLMRASGKVSSRSR